MVITFLVFTLRGRIFSFLLCLFQNLGSLGRRTAEPEPSDRASGHSAPGVCQEHHPSVSFRKPGEKSGIFSGQSVSGPGDAGGNHGRAEPAADSGCAGGWYD